VTTSSDYIAIPKVDQPTVSYFTRFPPKPVSLFDIKSAKVSINTKFSSIEDREFLTDIISDTPFDHLYKQYFEHASLFNLNDNSDSIYRYIDGALFTCNFDPVVVGQIRFNLEKTHGTFPEDGGKVRDLVLMERNKKGTILEEYGIPVVSILIDSEDIMSTNPSLPRFLGYVDTEEDFFVAMTYRKDGDIFSRKSKTVRTVMKSVKKFPFNKFTFDQVLDNTETSSNEAIKSFHDELDSATTVYKQFDQLRFYVLGKLLMPGHGISTYVLHASGASGHGLLDKRIFAIAKGPAAAIICVGTPDFDDQHLIPVLNEAFGTHGVHVTNLFGMVSESEVNGNIL